jgi:hypothetical protein
LSCHWAIRTKIEHWDEFLWKYCWGGHWRTVRKGRLLENRKE